MSCETKSMNVKILFLMKDLVQWKIGVIFLFVLGFLICSILSVLLSYYLLCKWHQLLMFIVWKNAFVLDKTEISIKPWPIFVFVIKFSYLFWNKSGHCFILFEILEITFYLKILYKYTNYHCCNCRKFNLESLTDIKQYC